jgi:predicted dehydrogenase
MKQLVQFASSGTVELLEVPVPRPKPRQIVVRTLASAVSTGTERGNLDFARANILEKALRRPDLVEKVISKAAQEGPREALAVARARLEEPFPLGYSSAGVVVELGEGATLFRPGQLVACSGARFATHSEYVAIPETLCAPVPDGVSADEAAFSALAGVVVHALRRGEVELGSRVAIVGLGLLGLLGVQIATASGARVVASDISPERCRLAEQLGAIVAADPRDFDAADRLREACYPATGADAVLVCATSKSNDPYVFGAELARERGIVVIVGNFPPDLPRRLGYDKELTVKFSRAWGPGTYDPSFFERGHPEGYPLSLVRWTAPQNMRTYLEVVAEGKCSVGPLITHRFPIDQATDAYELLDDPSAKPLGILIEYPDAQRQGYREARGVGSEASGGRRQVESRAGSEAPTQSLQTQAGAEAGPAGQGRAGLRLGRIFVGDAVKRKVGKTASQPGPVRLGIVGAGNHVASAILPVIRRSGLYDVKAIAAPSGTKAAYLARRFGIHHVATDAQALFEEADIEACIIATRHSSHAQLALEALRAGKHVLVEKPLAMELSEIDEIEALARSAGLTLLVGFNRRFSPLWQRALEHVAAGKVAGQRCSGEDSGRRYTGEDSGRRYTGEDSGQRYLVIRVNPGPLEPGHWVLDASEGGGRLVSEGCHFFDLALSANPSPPREIAAKLVGNAEALPSAGGSEGFVSTIAFADGSVASVVYVGSGPRSVPKESIEIFSDGRAAGIVDWKKLYLSGRLLTRPRFFVDQRKGFEEMLSFFAECCRDPEKGLELSRQVCASSRLTLAAAAATRQSSAVEVDESGRPLEGDPSGQLSKAKNSGQGSAANPGSATDPN